MLLTNCLFIIITLSQCYAIPFKEEWEEFKRKYNKKYSDEAEEDKRRSIFQSNMEFIESHNSNFTKGLTTFEVGMNHYGDMTQEEFEMKMLGVLPGSEGQSVWERLLTATRADTATNWIAKTARRLFKGFKTFFKAMESGMREQINNSEEEDEEVIEVDWVKKGAVTPARDQGFCGSCWAFSVVGALESHSFIRTGKLEVLSVQHLIDCTNRPEYDNEGCQGGILETSYQYIVDNKGILSENDYPYEEKNGECRHEGKRPAAFCKGFTEIFGDKSIKETLKNKGPVSTIMDATTIELRFYKKGVYKNKKCDGSTNHAVLLVGLGAERSQQLTEDYWLVKNSWGAGWGDGGLVKVSRDCSSGLDRYGVYPDLQASPS